MTAIKKLIDGSGNQYFPQTHTKAIVDDNGYSVESRMQAVQDVVNQAQMEIGVVPSDLTPTENSSNWVTSGGVYNALQNINDVLYEDVIQNIDFASVSTTSAYISPSTGKWASLSNYNCRMIQIEPDSIIRLYAKDDQYARYAFLTTNSYTTGNDPSYATGSSLTKVEAGTDTGKITVPSNAAYLYITCKQNGTYITPKKIEYITDITNTIDALSSKVESVEERMKMYTAIDPGTEYSGWFWETGVWANSSGGSSRHYAIPCSSGDAFRLTPKSGTYLSYAFLTAHTTEHNSNAALATGYSGAVNSSVAVEVTAPSNAAYLYLTKIAYYSSDVHDIAPARIEKIEMSSLSDIQDYVDSLDISVGVVETKNIEMEVGCIDSTYGRNSNVSYDATSENGYAFSSENGEFAYWRNTGLIKAKGTSYTMLVSEACSYTIFFYGSNRLMTSATTPTSVAANTSVTIDTSGVTFIRILLSGNGSAIPRPKVTLTGIFEVGVSCVAKIAKQHSTNADTIITPVWIENTFSSNDTTSTLQDTGAWHVDWGVLRLPDNYDPDGEPTRLIIYCHGGTPRYNPGCGSVAKTNDFWTTNHVDPTLFLKEGYAVMDMDAVFCIFNFQTDSFGTKPQAMLQVVNCYHAAYEFVTKNYNIKTDGILLGGYSFGGDTSLQLLVRSKLPILASAMLCPYVGEHLLWYGQFRTVMARSAGFTNFANITDADPIDSTNLAILEENYPKMLRANPMLATCHIPSKEEFFATKTINDTSSGGFVGNCSISENPVEWGKYVVSKWPAKFRQPIKIWACTGDDTAIPKRHAYVLYNAAINGGSNIQLRMIQGGSHQPALGNSAITISNYVTRFGETIATVPLVYAEMVRFWRRYEQ